MMRAESDEFLPTVLLYCWLNGVVEQFFFPGVERGRGPIAVNALVYQVAHAGRFLKDDACVFA